MYSKIVHVIFLAIWGYDLVISSKFNIWSVTLLIFEQNKYDIRIELLIKSKNRIKLNRYKNLLMCGSSSADFFTSDITGLAHDQQRVLYKTKLV